MSNTEYNYQHFNPRDYNLVVFNGYKVWEEYIDFLETTLITN